MKDFDIPDVYIAILPCYLDDYGDGTELIDLNGNVLRIKSSVKSCLKRTLKKYAVDLSAIKEKYAKSLGIKNTFPIPIASNFTLVQLKVRIPKVAKDVSYGYVCYEKIKEIEEHSTYCIVNVGDAKIKVYQKKITIEKHLRDAAMIKTFFANLSPLNFESNSSMYNLPATKADIALLYEEIVKIKYKIEKI
ncbi:hypothetical protein BVF91_01300 [Thermoanaerobacterium sp. PSU-2]|uniref:hypothetical protein n=1 Tax=Thermoanaerobacterium sp. PSU-2 TaxID=1930849 RepID=UPI000A168675|nr:hypothetical protein [Thermoanaerobacterium sp. PSU-2]ORX24543.1 hypothetical protein BVF91_01300 [Thermoanaerobacterium sp. PSU-2]